MQIINGWITQNEVAEFYSNGYLVPDVEYMENQFILFDIADGQGHLLTRYINGKCYPVKEHIAYNGTKHRNLEQQLAMNLLFDRNIELAIITGVAGCGKTFLAWAVGMELVKRGLYDYIIIGRPMQELDESLGTLPGDMKDKYLPYLAPFWDQMASLTERQYGDSTMEALMNRGELELIPLSLIKGRNLDKAFVILDEAEDMTIGQIQQAVTRIHNPIGEPPRTKLVLTGDLGQIDRKENKKGKSPLQYAIDYFEGEDLFGHVNLKESQRGRLAQLGADMARDYK